MSSNNESNNQSTNKIFATCQICGKEKQIHRCKLKTFKYCSEECKNDGKRRQVPHNKIPQQQKRVYECLNPLCSNTFAVLPHEEKTKRYCSIQCFNSTKTIDFKEELEVKKEKEKKESHRKIWFL